MGKVTVIGIVGNSVFLPVDRFHTGGETVEAYDAHFEYGGKGFNQAVAAARFGAEVTFIAAVGADGCDGIKAFLEAEGITPCMVKKNMPTAFAAIITDRAGQNRVTVYQGAQLDAADIDEYEEVIKNADVLLINNEVTEEVNRKAASMVPANTKIILNPAPSRKTSPSLLERITYFTPNEHEAEGLERYPNVIQTLGKRGSYIKALDLIVPATDDKPVDTTGAGDTFNGVLAAALADSTDLQTAVIYAGKASGKSVTKQGAVSSIPYRSGIE